MRAHVAIIRMKDGNLDTCSVLDSKAFNAKPLRLVDITSTKHVQLLRVKVVRRSTNNDSQRFGGEERVGVGVKGRG